MFSAIDQDVVDLHILPRLDGPTLASLSRVSKSLHMAALHVLAGTCGTSWPSTKTPLVERTISSFPRAHASFFSDVYPMVAESSHPDRNLFPRPIISAVDLFYRGVPIFEKVVRTGLKEWLEEFCFRIELLSPSMDVLTVPALVSDAYRCLEEDLTLSWIIIDPVGNRAADVSSRRAVSVERGSRTGEFKARFSLALAEKKLIHIVVTCGGRDGGVGLDVRQVSMMVEDIKLGMLNGKESFGVLWGVMRGRRGKRGKKREEESKKKYEEFMEKKEKQKMLRGLLELCVVILVLGPCGFVLMDFFLLRIQKFLVVLFDLPQCFRL